MITHLCQRFDYIKGGHPKYPQDGRGAEGILEARKGTILIVLKLAKIHI